MDWNGLDWVGSPGGVRYRVPYGANKFWKLIVRLLLLHHFIWYWPFAIQVWSDNETIFLSIHSLNFFSAPINHKCPFIWSFKVQHRRAAIHLLYGGKKTGRRLNMKSTHFWSFSETLTCFCSFHQMFAECSSIKVEAGEEEILTWCCRSTMHVVEVDVVSRSASDTF